MSEYIITKKQIEELNKAYGGMQVVTSWLSAYAIFDTSEFPPSMKSRHLAVTLPNIVRCKDCKFCMTYMAGTYCDYMAHVIELDGFCAWGVQKAAE